MRIALLFMLLSSLAWAGCENYFEQINGAHGAITHDLFNGYSTWGQAFGGHGNRHEVLKVVIHDPETGRDRLTAFKPRPYGDSEGWARATGEFVAYHVNRKLGMDYIAPVAYRYNFTINGNTYPEGALIHYVDDLHYLLDTPRNEWGISKTALLSDNRVLTVLLQNPDSIHNNLLIGKHWVDGKRRPVFMDWSASGQSHLGLSMTYYPYYRNDATVDHVREQTLNRLRKLHWNDLKEVTNFLSDNEKRDLLYRRDGIVQYFDRLIHERGYDNVVLKE